MRDALPEVIEFSDPAWLDTYYVKGHVSWDAAHEAIVDWLYENGIDMMIDLEDVAGPGEHLYGRWMPDSWCDQLTWYDWHPRLKPSPSPVNGRSVPASTTSHRRSPQAYVPPCPGVHFVALSSSPR